MRASSSEGSRPLGRGLFLLVYVHGNLAVTNFEDKHRMVAPFFVPQFKTKKMKRTLLKTTCAWLFLTMFAPLTASADVAINETNFPDENFRNWLLSQSYGEDKFITDDEIKKITQITIIGKNIYSLKGIEHFTALTWLDCDNNQLTSLDVSQNAILETLYCKNNQLSSLDISNNTALQSFDCSMNQLTSLDVSKNTEMTFLACNSDLLTSLDVSKNTKLRYLDCSYCKLPSLDISKNTVLEQLYCADNLLTKLDISQNTALTNLRCSKNQLAVLDVSSNSVLKFLECDNNKLTTLDVSNNAALEDIRCYGNMIRGTSMDAFINSLPQTMGRYIYIVLRISAKEGNICTKDQVETLKAKGWSSYDYYEPTDESMKYTGGNAPTTVTVSVGADGLATYCPAFEIDFSNAEKIAAYKASVDGRTVKLTKIDKVAAGEGVLLRSLTGDMAEETLQILETTIKSEDNAFAGTLHDIIGLPEKSGNFTNFVLFKKDGVVGFYKANNTPIAAWKAYLPVEGYNAEAAGARGLTLVFDDGNTTSISEINNATTADNAIYTLSGAHVKNPAKGLYIKNGKKVIVK